MVFCPLAVAWGNAAEWAAVVAALGAAVATVAAVVVALGSSRKEHQRTLALRDAEWDRIDRARAESAGVWAISFDLELRVADDQLQGLLLNLRSALTHAEPFEAFKYLNEDATLKGQFPLLRHRIGSLDDFPPEIRSRLLDVLSWWDRMSDMASRIQVSEPDYDVVTATHGLATVAAQFELLSQSIGRQRAALKPLFTDFPNLTSRTPEAVEAEFQSRRRALVELSPFPFRD